MDFSVQSTALGRLRRNHTFNIPLKHHFENTSHKIKTNTKKSGQVEEELIKAALSGTSSYTSFFFSFMALYVHRNHIGLFGTREDWYRE